MIASADLSLIVVGCHAGGVLRDVPWLSNRYRHDDASRPYRWLEKVVPSLFGAEVHAVARRHILQ
jgi:hypothetical protein